MEEVFARSFDDPVVAIFRWKVGLADATRGPKVFRYTPAATKEIVLIVRKIGQGRIDVHGRWSTFVRGERESFQRLTFYRDNGTTIKFGNSIRTAVNAQPKWEDDFLKPLLETCVDICTTTEKDARAVTQSVAVVLLAYDIIRLRNAVLTQADYDFVENAFDRFLSVDALTAISESVNAEFEQCSGLGIDFAALNALFILESLLSETAIHFEQEDTTACELVPILSDPKPVDIPVPAALVSTAVPSQPQPQTAISRDVQIQYYLNPGCAFEVDCVTSIDIPGKALMLETSVGRRVQIEEGVIVSEVKGKSRTVEVRAPTADGFDLSATVTIPPCNDYTIENVISVERVDEMLEWTIFETAKATIWVGSGRYEVERIGASIKVKNVYTSD
ncbi:uncharacterized protein N0V89_001989 [Didymosphaeria variabile]|uniref:Uncharacterized protein n=1 Tax=Didymosphaeria variabile TaxID=1932322 RepID=A0A9W9CE43_9PLEO|nr:uncharacterized protein N0V89_001989 [Didymosphaeria variabile]KAJ4357414.1 hypothetical protein N0V89_001989 [Didymosphaeria variabile]